MADTYTTNLNLTKPEPGAAEDTWGISLNADLDSLDAIFGSGGTAVSMGAVTLDGLTVDGDATISDGNPTLSLVDTTATNQGAEFKHNAGTTTIQSSNTSTHGLIKFNSNNGTDTVTRMQIDRFGDISFYDDTSSTQGFFWDASAERLGIGTTTPTELLHIYNTGGAGNDANVLIEGNGSGVNAKLTIDGHASGGQLDLTYRSDTQSKTVAMRCLNDGSFRIDTLGSEAMRIVGDNVGIGTTSPSAGLQVAKGSSTIPTAGASTSSACFGNDTSDDNYGVVLGANSSGVGYISSQRTDGTATTYNLAIQPNGGNVGIGTDNPSEELHLLNSGNTTLQIQTSGGGTPTLKLVSPVGTEEITANVGSVRNMVFRVGGSERARFDASGNFGIGTTPLFGHKFSVQASTDKNFTVDDNNGTGISLNAYNNSGSNVELAIKSNIFSVHSATAERFRITNAGNVGIGTDSPSLTYGGKGLNIENNDTAGITINDTTGAKLDLAARSSDVLIYGIGGYAVRFGQDATERMRIDTSGNLLVGKSSSSLGTAGHEIFHNGVQWLTASNSRPLLLNRLSTDGTIAEFRKDGTTVGSIGVAGGDISIGTGNVGFQFWDGGDAIYPWNSSTNSVRDGAIDLGYSGGRFQDIYATNGTIQTSDINEKQDIEDLSEAETRVAVAAKGLLKKYRWKSAVADKGDDARIHFGIMAQDLENAFANEGLDAGDYGMFISSTWEDDDGVEQTRLGVRYNELLAFIIAAI